ncbi:hypothetical protein ASG89_29545 [Paenibacillus sp. Soil766]|uniref:hypothetical protein n=1 Tax=Paenibacillus sp. Soil766 TaxID=1736404 RepID=UPI000708ABEC|nr:hypothetical protein [Paenibacillus sp. Soil766]KRE97750.1 hypothetical protein ASG89_29545 [Paenibacillus sp. Soil766]
MNTVVIKNEQPKGWKQIGFVATALLFVLFDFFFLEGATEALEPWLPSDCGGCNGESFVPDSYRWFAVSHGALLALMFGGSLIALLRRPFEKPMLLHFYAVGHLLFLASFAATAPKLAIGKAFVFVMFALILSILFAFYHKRAAAIKLAAPTGYSSPLLVLTTIAAIFLIPIAIHAGIQQWSETGEYFGWGEHTAMLFVLLYGSFLTASQRAGSYALGIIVSLTFMYLGVSALAVPDHPGSWGIVGGITSILFGVVYVSVMIYSNRMR